MILQRTSFMRGRVIEEFWCNRELVCYVDHMAANAEYDDAVALIKHGYNVPMESLEKAAKWHTAGSVPGLLFVDEADGNHAN